jgi:hypothetical protein
MRVLRWRRGKRCRHDFAGYGAARTTGRQVPARFLHVTQYDSAVSTKDAARDQQTWRAVDPTLNFVLRFGYCGRLFCSQQYIVAVRTSRQRQYPQTVPDSDNMLNR